MQFVCYVDCVLTCFLFHSWLNLCFLVRENLMKGKDNDWIAPVDAIYNLVPELCVTSILIFQAYTLIFLPPQA